MRTHKNDLKDRGILRTGYGAGRPNIWHAWELDDAARKTAHGFGVVRMPSRIPAGDLTTVVVEYHIAAQTIPAGGQLALMWRWAYDWSDLQTNDPAQQGYLSLSVESAKDNAEPAELQAHYNAYGGIEPYNHALKLKVTRGELAAGDCVRLVCGDQSAGSPGWRAPTLAADEISFLLLIDPAGTDQWTELVGPQSQTAKTVPREPVKLIAVAPSDLVVGETSCIIVRAEDCWGNAAVLDEPPALSFEEDNRAAVIEDIKKTADGRAYHAAILADARGLIGSSRRLRAQD